MALLTIVGEPAALAMEAVPRVAGALPAVSVSGAPATLCLTGGTTPRDLYRLCASSPWRTRIDWVRIHVFWTDERHVPPDHADSNFGMANERILRHVPIPPSHIHRMRGELPDAAVAATDYEAELSKGFDAAGRTDRTFDLTILGVGDDGHIASLFPDSPLLQNLTDPLPGTPRVAASVMPSTGASRITLTPAAVLDAHQILVLVAGEEKAEAVRAALEGARDEQRWPTQLLRRAGSRVEWIVDRAAASLLTDATRAQS